jgi:hypothetical protein
MYHCQLCDVAFGSFLVHVLTRSLFMALFVLFFVLFVILLLWRINVINVIIGVIFSSNSSFNSQNALVVDFI